MPKKSLPDDSFTGGRWRYSPSIVKCVACGAQGSYIGNGHGWRVINGVNVCDRDICYETVLKMYRAPIPSRTPLPPTLEEVEAVAELEAAVEAEIEVNEEPPPIDFEI